MRQNYIYFAFPFFSLQESVYERMKKSGGANSFNLFVIAEMECMHRLLAAVRETLLVSLVCSLLVSINYSRALLSVYRFVSNAGEWNNC